jgi:hypothetical protein
MPSEATRPSVGDRASSGDGPRRRAAHGAAAAVTIALGCSGAPGAGRTLGTDLGTFGVEATRRVNDCGPGALGESERLSFDVELARAETELFWDGRVGGRLGRMLDFEFATRQSFELRPARGADAGCAIARDDVIVGVLEPDATGELTAFSAEMRFDFATTRGSTCTAEEQALAELPRLPCRMSYALEGQRTRAPMP